MADDFEGILADRTTFPDSLEMIIGEKKIPLGTLRSMSQRGQDTVAQKLREAQARHDEAQATAAQAAELLEQLKKQVASTAPVEKTPEFGDFDTDPLWEPARKKLSPLEKQLKEVLDLAKTIEASQKNAALIWYDDRTRTEYRESRDKLKGDKYKEYRADDGYKKLRDMAATNKWYDEYGLPSVRKAISEITKSDDIETLAEQRAEQIVAERDKQRRLRTMPRPTSASGKPSAEVKGLDPSKNFEDLGDAVASDPELTEMLSKLGALGPEDIM